MKLAENEKRNLKNLEEEYKAVAESREVEKWQNSNSKESFETWKLKKYVDKRIWEVVAEVGFGIIVALIIFSIVVRR